VSTGQSVRELAVTWTKKREREGLGAVSRARKPLAEAISEWLDELEAKGRRPKTLRDYRIQARFWSQHFPGGAVLEVSRDGLMRFFKGRGGGPRLKNLNLVLWRSFSRWCLDKGYLEQDPTRGLKPWKEPQREPLVLSVEELRALLRACREPYSLEAPGAGTSALAREARSPRAIAPGARLSTPRPACTRPSSAGRPVCCGSQTSSAFAGRHRPGAR